MNIINVKDWLGENNKIGQDIWESKYRYNGESFDEWLDRISSGNSEVRELIKSKKFLFGGRILANRGLTKDGRKISYSNCYVISPPEDNIESIFDCAKKLARTYSYGGGCGTDISKLAPRGAEIHNAAKTTTGAVSFMDLYSMVTGLIGQKGRRGALMLSMSCDHPDIEEFINIKNNLNKINYANISVRVTNDFMKAVINDTDYTLSYTRKTTGEIISKTIKAKDLFHKLCVNNWENAEPGILFWDSICNWNLLTNTEDFEFAATNPCLTGDTLIQTIDGSFKIRDLVGTNPHVYCMDKDGNLSIAQANNVRMTKQNAEIVTVKTFKGSIRCTPDHLIYTTNRGWVEAGKLKHGDKIKGLNRSMKDEKHVAVSLSGGKYIPEHRFIAGYFEDIKGKDVRHKDGNTFNNTINNLEILEHSSHSALTNTGRLIENIRNNKGQYLSKKIKKKRDSFNQGKKIGTNWFVKSVTFETYTEDVYDMTVPEVHNFIANDMVVHNCAEEPLPPGGSCLLGSMNLSEYVKDKKFDFESYDKDVKIAVIALNEVLDEGIPLHPLKEQRDSVTKWRQIGLGIMGLADMLIKMELIYGSKESIDLCQEIAYHMINSALQASSSLANINGSYPGFNINDVISTCYLKSLSNPTTIEMIQKFGLRNSQLLTIAPTGTLSTMLGISGGIEPIFANYYTRTTKSIYNKDIDYKIYTPIVQEYINIHNLKDESALPEWFITSSDISYQNRINMQQTWQNFIDASISSTINLPENTTVEDIENIYIEAWKCGLKGITIFRDGCKRTAILNTKENSKTNLPSSITIPRGIIMDVPDNLTYRKYKIQSGCGSLYLFVGVDEDEGNIYDVFTNTDGVGGCVVNTQAVSRLLSACMRGGVPIEYIIEQLNKSGTCASYQSVKSKQLTIDKIMMISNDCLPNNIKNQIIEYRGKNISTGKSCASAISHVLQNILNEIHNNQPIDNISYKYVEKKEIMTIKNNSTNYCPECGTELIFSGGCVTCTNCGWSKCE